MARCVGPKGASTRAGSIHSASFAVVRVGSGRCVWIGAATRAGSVRSASYRGSKDTLHRTCFGGEDLKPTTRHAARAKTWTLEEHQRRYDRQTFHRDVSRLQGEPVTFHLCPWVCRSFTFSVPLWCSVYPEVRR